MREDTPIFWSVADEYRKAGRRLDSLPFRFVKPKGTIRFLEPMTTGIEPLYNNFYKRPVTHCTGADDCVICQAFKAFD